MAAFTSIADAAWQTLLSELTLAYSERRQAIGQAAYVAADGRDVQAVSYWTAMQGWVETYCGSFVDHVNGPLNAGGTDFRCWTFSTLLAAMGNTGWRRATAWTGTGDPTWAADGQMQAGDILSGPWVWEDLQSAFSLLRWTKGTASLDMLHKAVALNGGDYMEHKEDLAWMKAKAEADFAAQTPGAGVYRSSNWTSSSVLNWDAGGGLKGYDVSINRSYGTAQCSAPLLASLSDSLAWSLYTMGITIPDWQNPYVVNRRNQYNTFDDFTTAPTVGVLSEVASGTATSSPITTNIGKNEPPEWAEDLGDGWASQEGHAVWAAPLSTSIAFLLKWNFTNA